MRPDSWLEVLNLYDWLPPYGESGVRYWSDRMDWIVEIEYDADDIASEGVKRRELRFQGVCAFYKQSFPGPFLLRINHGEGGVAPELGSLIEYPESDAAVAWTRHFGARRLIKHYRIIFLAENTLVEVFAEGFALGEVDEGDRRFRGEETKGTDDFV